jgi:hypothetical protein
VAASPARGVGALLPLPSLLRTPSTEDFSAAVGWVDRNYQAGDGLVCAGWACELAVDYYTRVDGGPRQLAADSLGGWSWEEDRTRPIDPQALAAYAARHRRIFLVDALWGIQPPETVAQAKAAQAWLDQNGDLLDRVTVNGPLSVRLYADLGGAPTR